MERILIIEDEEKIARFVQLELEFEGYQVEKALDGREGLALAKAHPFDLILLDIMLPGLDGGADDYITKPFAIEELLARIRVALRKKTTSPSSAILEAGTIRLDPVRRECWVASEPIELTKKEFDLLQHLMENKNIVLTREVLLEKIWGYDFEGETNVVDVYIRYLRAKLEEPFALKLIHTVRGVGYVIKDE